MSSRYNNNFNFEELPEFLKKLLEKWSQLKNEYPYIIKFIELINEHNIAIFLAALSKWFNGNEALLKEFVQRLFSGTLSGSSFIFSKEFTQLLKSLAGKISDILINPKVAQFLKYAHVIAQAAVLLYGLVGLWQCFRQISNAKNVVNSCKERIAFLKEKLVEIARLMADVDADWESLKMDVQRGIFDKKRLKMFELKVGKLKLEVHQVLSEIRLLKFDVEGKIESLEEEEPRTWGSAVAFAIMAGGFMRTSPWMALASITIAAGYVISGVISRETLEELRGQLKQIKEILESLQLFSAKIEAIQIWIIENEERFEGLKLLQMKWTVVEQFERRFTKQQMAIGVSASGRGWF